MLGARGMVGLIVPSNNNVVLPGILFGAAAGRDGLRDPHAGRRRAHARGAAQDDRGCRGGRGAAAPDRGRFHLLLLHGEHHRQRAGSGNAQLLARFAGKAPKGSRLRQFGAEGCFAALGAKRLALVTPYPDDLNVASA